MERPSTLLRLRVTARSGRSEIVGRYGEAWKVRVAAPPHRGKANEELLTLLADTLHVPLKSLELVAGKGQRDKVVGLVGLSDREAEERLELAAGHRMPAEVGR